MMNDELRPYELKQVNDIPWIERIPAHWDIQRGKAVYKKLNRPTRSNDEVVTCFRDGVVTLRKNRRTTGFTESIKEIGYQGIRKGDLVIHVMDAFAGAIGVSDSDGKGTPVYSVCEAKVDLNNNYYAYVIREMAKTGFIQSLYRGIRERSSDFRFEVFANQYLPIPPRSEQDQIVKYLDHQLAKINKFIKAKKKLIAVLKEQKQAIINEAVTRGLDPNVKMRPSGIEWIGDVPEHWKKTRVKHIFRIENGATPTSGNANFWGGEIKWITPNDLSKVEKDLNDSIRKLTTLGFENCSTKLITENNLVLASRAPIGNPRINRVSLCTNQGCKGLVLKNKTQSIDYFYYVFLAGEKSLQKLGVGTTFPEISTSKLGGFEICVPPCDEQFRISVYLDNALTDLNNIISQISEEIILITEYKNSLTSNVVTGKVDVRNIVIEELEEEIIEDIELDEDSTDKESLEAEDGDE